MPLAPQLRAFERTYRAEGPYVAAVLGRLAVPSEAVHDAVQDVFVAAYRRWPDYDTTRPVRPWLTAFAHRVAFRYRRSQARRERKRAALRHVLPAEQRSDASKADARAFLERFLGTLPTGHREAFVLAELEGRTAAEVGQALGISAEAVYGRVRSVRKRLHQALMEDAKEPGARAAAMVPPWAVLLPQLGGGAAVAGTGLAALKVFAATVVVGAAGLVGVAVSTPDVQPAPVTVAAQHMEDEPPPAAPSAPASVEALPPEPAPGVPTEPSPRRAGSLWTQEAEPLRPRGVSPQAARVAPVPAATVDKPPASALAAESALLREARAAQADGRLRDALALLDRHARQFPEGQLASGRRRARIRVLCDLGQTAQARGEAKMLARTHPDDPLAVQALSICAAPIQSAARPEKQG